MDKEMIERVATAITERRTAHGSSIEMAIDAIKALREPTQAMCDADEVHTNCYMCGGHKEGYQRLLCAIIGDKYND